MCASWKTPSIAPSCCALDDEISADSITLTGTGLAPAGASSDADSALGDGDDGGTKPLVGRTVADVEKDLIIETLSHCLGNRTHAANILGISIPHAAQQAEALQPGGHGHSHARRGRTALPVTALVASPQSTRA